MSKVKARNNFVLLDATEHTAKEYTTDSGLIVRRKLNQQVRDELERGPQFTEANVESVGENVREVKAGDRVLISPKRGIICGRYIEDDRTYVWIQEKDIMAIVE